MKPIVKKLFYFGVNRELIVAGRQGAV